MFANGTFGVVKLHKILLQHVPLKSHELVDTETCPGVTVKNALEFPAVFDCQTVSPSAS
jgi:hypothetical protein